jgi:hypothetical protein
MAPEASVTCAHVAFWLVRGGVVVPLSPEDTGYRSVDSQGIPKPRHRPGTVRVVGTPELCVVRAHRSAGHHPARCRMSERLANDVIAASVS